MKLNDRLKEIARIDRDIAAMEPVTEGNVIHIRNVRDDTELHRQRADHVAAIQAYRVAGGTR